MLLDEIREIKSGKKELRKFAYTIGIVLLVIGAALIIYEKTSYPYFLGLGLLLCLIGVISPSVLKAVYKIWMGFAVVLGFIMTRIILSLLFYFVFTPMRLIARIFGKKFVDLNFKEDTESYWNKRETKLYEPIDTERQF